WPMIEMTIYGRGGQGGVTLAKLIATAYFLRDKYAQAFGVYAAERSGAPIQAYVRVDEKEITNHNQILEPDHVIVIDHALIAPHVLSGLKEDGWVMLNTPGPPNAFQEMFAGRRVATLDATSIAVAHQLGTRTVPIVNTAILGMAAKVLQLPLEDVEAALEELKFGGANLTVAREAFERVEMKKLPGKPARAPETAVSAHVAGLFDDEVGDFPRIRTGSWASRKPDRRRSLSPCAHVCPAGNDIQAFVQQVTKKEYDNALATLLKTTPFPSICGRVCPAPCMEACNRAEYDEPVDIRELERYVGDKGQRPAVTRPHRQQRLAAVGSGPAGLAATYHLARLGYPVTLFEADDELGGVMRTGIPSYRLPRDVLDREVSYILRHGVEVKTNQFVDRAELLRLTREFAAVFVATGLQELRSMNLGQLNCNYVVQGIDFLDQTRRGQGSCRNQRVVVVGGGNTAFDAARTAKRLGASSVRLIYRRTRAEMPAIAEEIYEGIAEGVQVSELVLPLRLGPAANGAVLTCTRMKLGQPDESGRPRPIPETSEDAQFDLPCDKVILALGQSRDLSILPEGAEVHEEGQLLGLTGAPVLAGGDFATNEGTVTAAIGSGYMAALHIYRTLTGEDLFPPKPARIAGPEMIHAHLFAHVPRERTAVVPPTVRRTSFTEVKLGLVDEPGHDAAVAEAERCFSCGVCNECDRCVSYCPEGVLLREQAGEGYRFDFDFCKGCGICASQCPRGVIYMAAL
ncbi:MAG: 2-oxoacid:acceptor oxidoreductase family protein, partial [Phycisphaerae bacterium]